MPVVLGGSLAGLLAARVLSDHFDEVTLIEREVLAATAEVRRGIAGGARDYPPSDEAGFLEFARSLPVSTIYDAMRAAEPLTPIKTHRGTENRLRQFDRAKELPENVLKERKLHENADRNHGRERQVGGRQKVSENRLVS